MTYWFGLPTFVIGIPATLIIIYAWCAFARVPKRWQ